MTSPTYQKIPDPVYGAIGLSELETKVVNSPVFQRLRRVKHLSLVDLVFPSAGFSRFTHSLGTCHVMGKFLEQLPEVSGRDELVQRYRLAALLHDVGQYPLSHMGETAIRGYYRKGLPRRGKGSEPSDRARQAAALVESEVPPSHEALGREIVLSDPELAAILTDSDRDFVAQVVGHDVRRPLDSLLDADLDADRIDYLLRSSFHTRLPYGSVDFEYLTQSVRFGQDEHPYLDTPAMRAAEHMFLCRVFDYVRVAHNKTAVALDLLFADVVEQLLRSRRLEVTKSWVAEAIRGGTWRDFDDSAIWRAINEVARATTRSLNHEKARALVDRNPPALAYQRELFTDSEDTVAAEYRDLAVRTLGELKPKVEKEFHLEPGRLWVWARSIDLTSISRSPIAEQKERGREAYRGLARRALKILDFDRKERVPLFNMAASILSQIGRFRLDLYRIYVLVPPPKRKPRDYREYKRRYARRIRQRVARELEIPIRAAPPRRR